MELSRGRKALVVMMAWFVVAVLVVMARELVYGPSITVRQPPMRLILLIMAPFAWWIFRQPEPPALIAERKAKKSAMTRPERLWWWVTPIWVLGWILYGVGEWDRFPAGSERHTNLIFGILGLVMIGPIVFYVAIASVVGVSAWVVQQFNRSRDWRWGCMPCSARPSYVFGFL